MSYVNIFGGETVQPVNVSYSAITLSASIVLNWPTQFQDTNDVVSNIMDVTPSAGGFTITLPDATLTSVGQTIIFNNVSGSHSFQILDNTGALLATLAFGNIIYIYLTNNTTQGGSWRLVPFGLGVTVVTSVAAASLTPGLTITGSPITSAGTLDFSLSTDLVSLTTLGTTGIAVRTTNGGTWATRSLVAGSNIILTNADGTAGNPSIALNTTVNGLISLTVGNLNLSQNILSTTGGNTNLFITPNGTGSVFLGSNGSPVSIDTNNNIVTNSQLTAHTVQANTAFVANFPLAPIARAWGFFDGATATLQLNTPNVASVARASAGSYSITFSPALAVSNYLVVATCVASSSATLYIVNSAAKSTTTCVFYVFNSSIVLADAPVAFTVFY
jgi:hypothetical protein